MRPNPVLPLPLALGLSLLTGCVLPCVTTTVTSSVQPGGAERRTFVLQGPDPRYQGGDPLWPTYARILARALESRGFVAATGKPELVLRVSYRVGDTQTWTTTTSTDIQGVTGAIAVPTFAPDPSDPAGAPVMTAVSVPTVGVVGTSESTSTSSSSLHTLKVEALDPDRLGPAMPGVLWRTHAASRGAGDDLLAVFPFLVSAMEPWFGVPTPAPVEVRIFPLDAEVRRLRAPGR